MPYNVNGIPLITDRTQADVDRTIYLNSLWENDETGNLVFTGTDDEWAEWFSAADNGARGAYDAPNINRVSQIEAYLEDVFNALPKELQDYYDSAIRGILDGLEFDQRFYTFESPVLPTRLKEVPYDYPVPLKPIKTDWGKDDYPSDFTDAENNVYDVSYYLDNINTLRELIPVTAPDTPDSLNTLSYRSANDIERILGTVFTAYLAYADNKKIAIDEAQSTEADRQHRMSLSWLYSNEILAGEI